MLGFLIGGIFIVLAAGLAWWNFNNMKKAKAAAAWPTCKGKILSHNIEHRVSRSRKGGTTHTYEPVIGYSYEKDGQSYSGGRMNYSNTSYSSQASAQNALNAYPVGSDVNVFVNPANASDCTLSATAKVNWILPIAFGAAGLLAIVIFGNMH